MRHRNPIMVILLSIITLGIYSLFWYGITKHEMNAKGARIPTAWLAIIPFVGLYWLWKFSEGVEIVTNKEMESGTAFLLLLFFSIAGMATVQDELNGVAT